MKSSNEGGYRQYRHYVERMLNSSRDYDHTRPVDSDWLVLAGDWRLRYHLRRAVLTGISLFGIELGDRPGRELIVKRNEQRDQLWPDIPDWPKPLHNTLLVPELLPEHMRDPDQLLMKQIHPDGPSVRQLWWRGLEKGLSNEDAWQEVRDWVRHRPPSWDRGDQLKSARKPLYARALVQRLQQTISWQSTGDIDYPWLARSGPEIWRVRLNDYPDEYMYSLLIGDQLAGDFHDWPETWTRPEGPGWIDEVKKKKMAAAFVPPSDIVAGQLLPRYLSGDHERVWADMVRLRSAVRREPYLEPALAVCREMTRRSRQNLITLFGRLAELDYRFWSVEQKRLVTLTTNQGKEPWKEKSVWKASDAKLVKKIATLEKGGIVLPLAVRVWLEEIGEVSLVGSHPVLCPFASYETTVRPEAYADPFMVLSALAILPGSLRSMKEEDADLVISFDDTTKAELALDEGGDDYHVVVPNSASDAELTGCWYETTFMGYVRRNFQWGGFPGWERYPNRPEKELAYLREGLAPV